VAKASEKLKNKGTTKFLPVKKALEFYLSWYQFVDKRILLF
jgi:hypothetical protein